MRQRFIPTDWKAEEKKNAYYRKGECRYKQMEGWKEKETQKVRKSRPEGWKFKTAFGGGRVNKDRNTLV